MLEYVIIGMLADTRHVGRYYDKVTWNKERYGFKER